MATQQKFCHECGDKLIGGEKFCSKCGANLISREVVPTVKNFSDNQAIKNLEKIRLTPNQEKEAKEREQRIKAGLLKIKNRIREIDTTGLRIIEGERGREIWYPDNRKKTDPDESVKKEVDKEIELVEKYFYKPLFDEKSADYCGISREEFRDSPEFLNFRNNLLNKKNNDKENTRQQEVVEKQKTVEAKSEIKMKDLYEVENKKAAEKQREENIKATAKQIKQYKEIKCGNCGYEGVGEPARRIISMILAWLCILFFWPATVIYFVATNKYRCPKCHSNFIAMKNKDGIYVKQKISALIILLIVLMVIAFIGLLSTLSIVALNSAREKVRDAIRISSIRQIQNAARLYYSDTGEYPKEIISGQEIKYNNIVYMATVPSNPKPNDGDCNANFEYTYTPSVDRLSYALDYCLGADMDGISAGFNTAWPGGMVK